MRHKYHKIMVSVGKFDFKSDKILSSLSPTDKQLFLKFAEHLNFKKRKLIFYEGGVPTGVFLISKGRAKISNWSGTWGNNRYGFKCSIRSTAGIHY